MFPMKLCIYFNLANKYLLKDISRLSDINYFPNEVILILLFLSIVSLNIIVHKMNNKPKEVILGRNA